jgi:hypothetical protein
MWEVHGIERVFFQGDCEIDLCRQKQFRTIILKASRYGLLWEDQGPKAQDDLAARCVLWPLFQLAVIETLTLGVPSSKGDFTAINRLVTYSMDWWCFCLFDHDHEIERILSISRIICWLSIFLFLSCLERRDMFSSEVQWLCLKLTTVESQQALVLWEFSPCASLSPLPSRVPDPLLSRHW